MYRGRGTYAPSDTPELARSNERRQIDSEIGIPSCRTSEKGRSTGPLRFDGRSDDSSIPRYGPRETPALRGEPVGPVVEVRSPDRWSARHPNPETGERCPPSIDWWTGAVRRAVVGTRSYPFLGWRRWRAPRVEIRFRADFALRNRRQGLDRQGNDAGRLLYTKCNGPASEGGGRLVRAGHADLRRHYDDRTRSRGSCAARTSAWKRPKLPGG